MRGRTIALMLVAALAMSACETGEPGPGSTTVPPSTGSSPSPAVSNFLPSDDPWAVWPEDTKPESGDAWTGPDDLDRRDAEHIAEEFARRILEWDAPVIEPYAGPVDCDERECVQVRRDDAAPALLVQTRAAAANFFLVTGVSPVDDEVPLGLSVQGSIVAASFDLGEAVSAVLEIGYGEAQSRHVYTETDTAAWDLGFDPEGPGHYLLLLKDEAGTVIAALGSPLPAGDFAAG